MTKMICVPMMTRRRSMMSDSAPANKPNASDGTVLAVCTSATISGDGVIVAMSQPAIAACIV